METTLPPVIKRQTDRPWRWELSELFQTLILQFREILPGYQSSYREILDDYLGLDTTFQVVIGEDKTHSCVKEQKYKYIWRNIEKSNRSY